MAATSHWDQQNESATVLCLQPPFSVKLRDCLLWVWSFSADRRICYLKRNATNKTLRNELSRPPPKQLNYSRKGELSCLALILGKSIKGQVLQRLLWWLILFLRDPDNDRIRLVIWNITKSLIICAMPHFQYFLNIALKSSQNFSSYFANDQTNA